MIPMKTSKKSKPNSQNHHHHHQHNPNSQSVRQRREATLGPWQGRTLQTGSTRHRLVQAWAFKTPPDELSDSWNEMSSGVLWRRGWSESSVSVKCFLCRNKHIGPTDLVFYCLSTQSTDPSSMVPFPDSCYVLHRALLRQSTALALCELHRIHRRLYLSRTRRHWRHCSHRSCWLKAENYRKDGTVLFSCRQRRRRRRRSLVRSSSLVFVCLFRTEVEHVPEFIPAKSLCSFFVDPRWQAKLEMAAVSCLTVWISRFLVF